MAELLDHETWLVHAAEVAVPTGLFVDGRFVDDAEDTMPVVSPRDGTTVTTVASAGAKDVDAAVAAARRAFDHGPWPRMAPRERARHLLAFAALIEEAGADLALLVTVEMGKPIRDSFGVELPAVARCFRWYAELVDKEHGEVPPTGADSLALVTREPVGVVAAVVPWNFPLTMAAWKLAPALAAGCTAVLKPAEQSPLSALRLAELAAEAGLPDGVLNVVNGPGPVTGRALGEHPDVDVVAFTGSARTGAAFLRYAADSNLKPVWLELGGKSANIVLPDAPDLAAAADAVAWAVFFNAGQMCTAGSRLVVHRDIAEQFVEAILDRAAAYAPGDPLDPATRMGPVIGSRERDTILRRVADAEARGARVLCGGRAARTGSGGSYLAPTVLDRVANTMPIAREEIFGPVLSVLTVDSADEAVRVANDTEYGLAAAIWTADLRTAHRAARALRAGTVWVNCYEEGDMTVPFGGVKRSGHGRDKSRHALDKYTALKTTWITL